ncbi:MAG: hypothetical protein KJ726_04550, partial [Verrucomicrobia bacterium]|nr:hypothetical protein [Verrucomicrobiota bacterium]
LWWLAQLYAVTTNGDELALSDEDADSHAAWQEYIAGTLPTSFPSCLHFNQLGESADGTLVFRWQGVFDRLYSLQYASNVAAEAWTPDPTFTDIPGTGGEMCRTSSLPQQWPCGLYRVGVRLTP